jgi:protein-tyrosine phosphatase
MIDIHCHLLPGIDDGPATLEEALALARALVADGITQVVATPHVFPGRHDNGCANIRAEHARFVQALATYKIPLQLAWAGEVRLTPEVLDLLPAGELPFLGQFASHKTMLVEMPDGQVPLGADQFAARLLALGIRPVIVHPERNRGVMERVDRLRPFVEMGCAVQLTAGSLVGQFGAKAQSTAQTLLDEGLVTCIASDAHNLQGRRPRMADARAWLAEHYGAATASRLTREGPASLCGLPLPAEAPSGIAAHA